LQNLSSFLPGEQFRPEPITLHISSVDMRSPAIR